MSAGLRTPICDTLGIRHPIFGFSHSVDVCVAIAQAGGFPVLGLAREMPHEIPPLLAEVEQRMGAMPYGIDLMLPSGVPQAASTFQVSTSTDVALAVAPSTVALGGQLTSGVGIAFTTSGDKVPGTVSTGNVTLGFTVATAIPVGGIG